MYVIGITGGVGAGKTKVLELLRLETNCYIIRCDDVANEIKKKGNPCYDKIVDLLGEGIIGADGEIDRNLMSMIVFSDESKMKLVEQIIHPGVKRYVTDRIEEKRRDKDVDYVFVEAALLIEEGYAQICDEIWYIYASIATRTKRLMNSRGYSLTKIESIMDMQLKEDQFRKSCQCIIDNDGDIDLTLLDIRNALR